jgi:glycosyltransferase involved in cell wall biosynthesis
MQKKIDIVIATRGRPWLLEKCLTSLKFAIPSQADFQIQILLCISGGDDSSRAVAESFQSELPLLLHLERPFLNAAAARNKLIPYFSADWLFFIDDDAFVENDFFSIFKRCLDAEPDAVCIGGPNFTPRASSSFQHASGAVLSSRFGAAKSSVRYASDKPKRFGCGEESLILCNLFVRADIMTGRRFPEGLASNEENWLLLDLMKSGHSLTYQPELFVWHERRPKLNLLTLQIHRYGIGRGQLLRYRPEALRLFHLVPAAAVAFTLVSLIAFPWVSIFFRIWLLCLAGYTAAWLIALLRVRTTVPTRTQIYLIGGFLFPLIHVAYGLGILRGLNTRIDS